MTDAPDAAQAASLLSEAYDALVQRFGGDDRADDLAAARELYDRRRGRVFEDEELWELWSRCFTEWYVVERVPPGQQRPLAARALAGEADPVRTAALRAWLTSHPSLYEVRGVRPGRSGGIVLHDLLGGAEFSVSEQRKLHGVAAGDVLEARLIGFGGAVHFGRAFCFHPAGTREAIVTHARSIFGRGGSRRDVLDYCASLRLRCEHYRHVAAARIYERGSGEFPLSGAASPAPPS